MAKKFSAMSLAMGITTQTSQAREGEPSFNHGKANIKEESGDAFSFAPRPVQVELPIFTVKDPKEWLASANDFFELYNTHDHRRVTKVSFRMEGTSKNGTDRCNTNTSQLTGITWSMPFTAFSL
ncbi:hypothetical protein HRI_000267600 [Hibiscus trionum]|uniref:Uncharacterized protein n=1 Tax=Hibiscus trionum TaxID=183268 RepID=A0A9W7GVH0_HIBTR|nr:hypothetical protein HRI_000267600 [Hibiscus trionum]